MLASARAARAVTFVVDGVLEQPTGGYIYDRFVVQGLRTRGVAVEVMSLETGDPVAILRENVRLARRMAEAHPDEIFVIDELCHPRALAAGARRGRTRKGARLVTLVHHLAASERAGWSAAMRLAVERVLLGSSDLVVTTSQTTSEAVVAAGVEPARVRVARPGRDRLGVRSRPSVPHADRIVRLLFLGALVPRKGVDVLLAAFDRLPERARLTLAGPADRDHAYAATVLAHAARHAGVIRLTGALADDELARELDNHDVLVLPSRHEGFGIVLAEAISFGLAVVSTIAGAIPEVVRHGREALLVEPGDPAALAAALQAVTSDPARLGAMKLAALERARELPTWADTQRAFAEALGGLSTR